MKVSGPGPTNYPYLTGEVRTFRPSAQPQAAAPVGARAAYGIDQAARPTASLQDILTPEERDFFMQQADMGPVTYGRTRSGRPVLPPIDAPLGQRIDVRA